MSLKYKYIGWIPTSRAGSKTIRTAFKAAGIWHPEDVYDVPNRHGFFVVREIQDGLATLNLKWWEKNEHCRDDVYLFTVIRNPYDRAVSAWLHSIKQGWVPHEYSFEAYLKFLWFCLTREHEDDFVLPNRDDLKINNTWAHGTPIYALQHQRVDLLSTPAGVKKAIFDWVFNDAVAPPPDTISRHHRGDALNIIRLENLQTEIDNLCDMFDWPRMVMPKEHQAHISDYAQYYNDSTLKLADCLYAYEIDLGGYTGPTSSRV